MRNFHDLCIGDLINIAESLNLSDYIVTAEIKSGDNCIIIFRLGIENLDDKELPDLGSLKIDSAYNIEFDRMLEFDKGSIEKKIIYYLQMNHFI
jgi:hypothetical protein